MGGEEISTTLILKRAVGSTIDRGRVQEPAAIQNAASKETTNDT